VIQAMNVHVIVQLGIEENFARFKMHAF